MTDPQVVTRAPNLARVLREEFGGDATPSALQDRGRGALLGLAAGNLLGLPVESASRHHIGRRYPEGVTEIDSREASRPMDDDLAQAVDLGEALLTGGNYTREFAHRLVRWRRENGRGIGVTTSEVIDELERGHELPEPARIIYERKNRIAPNGGVMRCAPVALARHTSPELLVSDSAVTCAVTHIAPTCQWSCIIINAAISLLLRGVAPDLPALIAAAQADGSPDLATAAAADGIPTAVLDSIADGSAVVSGPDWLWCDQRLIGHTLLATQAGLWAAVTPHNLEDALVGIVNSGGDTDTNGAVAGAVLGARYGASAIPQRWLDCIPQRKRIETLAGGLLAMAT